MDSTPSEQNGNGDQETPVQGKRRISKSRRVVIKEIRVKKEEAQQATEPQAPQSEGTNPFTYEGNPFTENNENENAIPEVHDPQPKKVNENRPTLFTIDETSPAEKNKASRFFPQQDAKHRHYNQEQENQKSKEELFKISEQKSKANKRLENTQNQVNEVVGIMAVNVDRIKQRELKLDEALIRTETLLQKSEAFKKTTGKIKKKYWWEDMKSKLMLGCCVFIFLLAVIGAAVYFALG